MPQASNASRKLITRAWQSLRPLLEQAAINQEEPWLAHYVGNMAEMDDYIAGSQDRFAMIIDQLSPHLTDNATLLDAGAGYGIQAAACKLHGWNAHASDLYNGLSLYSTLNIPYRRGT